MSSWTPSQKLHQHRRDCLWRLGQYAVFQARENLQLRAADLLLHKTRHARVGAYIVFAGRDQRRMVDGVQARSQVVVENTV